MNLANLPNRWELSGLDDSNSYRSSIIERTDTRIEKIDLVMGTL
jgi:hypothetical protein